MFHVEHHKFEDRSSGQLTAPLMFHVKHCQFLNIGLADRCIFLTGL